LVVSTLSEVVGGDVWEEDSLEYKKIFTGARFGGIGFRQNSDFAEAAWISGLAVAFAEFPTMEEPREYYLQAKTFNTRVIGVVYPDVEVVNQNDFKATMDTLCK